MIISLGVVNLPYRPKAVKLLVQLGVGRPSAQTSNPDASRRGSLAVANFALKLANVLTAHLHFRSVSHVKVEKLDESVGIALTGRRSFNVNVLDDAVALKDASQVRLGDGRLEIAYKERPCRLVVLFGWNVVQVVGKLFLLGVTLKLLLSCGKG